MFFLYRTRINTAYRFDCLTCCLATIWAYLPFIILLQNVYFSDQAVVLPSLLFSWMSFVFFLWKNKAQTYSINGYHFFCFIWSSQIIIFFYPSHLPRYCEVIFLATRMKGIENCGWCCAIFSQKMGLDCWSLCVPYAISGTTDR